MTGKLTVLALRSQVFVVEQHSIYIDPDGRDLTALHLLGWKEGELAGYSRLLPSADKHPILFGRVVIEKSARGKGYGKKLIEKILAYSEENFPGISIQCSAQHHLKKFYEEFGFKTCSNTYLEGGIAHIDMRKEV